MIILDKTILGISGENLQGKIIFNFEEFVDGVAWLEIEKENGEKGYIQMTKENETYTLEIKSSLLSQAGYIYMQLRITQDENVNGIPVFKSKKFYVEVLNAINATATIEDDYPNIIDIVNNKLEADDILAGDNITIEKSGKKVIINSAGGDSGGVSKKYVDDQDTKTLSSAKQYANEQVPVIVETYVNEHKEELRGEKGDTGSAGADAKINGVNTLSIEAGTNITLEQEGNTLTINSTGGSGGTSNYNALTNKPKINNVELNGNKTSSDLGIQPAGDYALESDIPDVSNFITNSVNNLLNYYLKSETYTKQEVNNLIGQIATLQFQVVSTLPQTGDSKYIYLVPSSNPKTQNVKDEYIWVNNSWEQIGSTQIDLTGYATENWVNTQISGFLTQTQIQALINTALSEYTETDPTVPSHVKNITQANITSWNNKSDFSGNYNDLSNKPTIPSEVTESTVSGWGFTKNTGTYSKPSGGIPKTDLASAVQTSLGKADTALQSISSSDVTSALGYTPYNSTNPNGYTSNVGTITGITMNGASKGTSGVVDLGTVITSHQDISGKANKISVVQTSTSTIEINSNTFYKFGEVASLNITLASITDNTIYNEYMFEFVSGTTATTLTLPSSIKWLETPTIDANKIYQCSIVDNVGLLVGVTNV